MQDFRQNSGGPTDFFILYMAVWAIPLRNRLQEAVFQRKLSVFY